MLPKTTTSYRNLTRQRRTRYSGQGRSTEKMQSTYAVSNLNDLDMLHTCISHKI
jgi:hypothetical protein